MDLEWIIMLEDNIYFFFLSYALLGGGIKYIDGAFDDSKFNKKIAVAVAPLLGVLWSLTMLLNKFSFAILFAVIIGVLLKGKIDNIAHIIGFSTIFVFTISYILLFNHIAILFFPLIFLAAAAFIDEVGNDIIKNYKKFRIGKKFKFQFIRYFFGRRYLMKVAILYNVLLNIFPIYFLVAFLLFDESYILVDLYIKSNKK